MRIVARKTIVNFYQKHSDSKIALEEWYSKTHRAEWTCSADIKQTFNSVDSIGNDRFVFNIKGNDYRLVALIIFKIKTVYVRFIGTHAEYDKTNCSKI
jgi:mRNA interferase HigB